MTRIRVHTLPLTWDEARDTPFFRIAARLFPAEFCLGASVLLVSYDDVTSDVAPADHPSLAPFQTRGQGAAATRTRNRSASAPAQAPAGERL